jgi:hypothetical protein
MNTSTSIRVATAAMIVAGALSPVALAGGEPKNELPFTRPVGDRALTQVQPSSAQVVGVGEPKNQPPFARPVAGASDGPTALGLKAWGERLQGEARVYQQLRSGTARSSADGFNWSDAGIGVGAGLGIAALVAGGLVLTYRGPRGRRIGAAATR